MITVIKGAVWEEPTCAMMVVGQEDDCPGRKGRRPGVVAGRIACLLPGIGTPLDPPLGHLLAL